MPNACKTIASLNSLNALILCLCQNAHGQMLDVSEPVFGYALNYLGTMLNNRHFAQATVLRLATSAMHIHAIATDIMQCKIAFFVNNSLPSSKTIDSFICLACENCDSVQHVTETLELGKNTRTWKPAQYRQLEKIQNQTDTC